PTARADRVAVTGPPAAGATIGHGAPRWTSGFEPAAPPIETDGLLTRPADGRRRARLRRNPVAERPHDDAPDYAAANGWDREFETYSDFDLPTYVGPSTFMNLPWITDPDELRRRAADV